MSFMPFVVILSVLAIVVLALLTYRSKLTAREDDTIHINEGEEQQLGCQEVLAEKVAKVDRVSKILAAVVVVGSIALLAAYIYINEFAYTGVKMG